ncbi:MAG: DMT family transporter [Rhodospirillales bacterium]|nr:DMT family transporter [Rhodospirillales bacterium]
MAESSPPLHGSRLYLALFYMLCMGLVWGLQFSMAKVAVQGGIHPLGFTLATSLSAGTLLAIVARFRGAKIPLRRGFAVYMLVAGAIAVSIPNSVAALVVGHVPAGLAAVVNTLSPVFTYAIAWAVGMEKRHNLRILGIGFGVVGALLVVVPRASLPDPEMAPWVALCLLVPFFYALSNVYIAWARPDDVDSVALASSMQLGSAICILPVALALGAPHMPLPPQGPGDWALIVQCTLAGLGSLLFFEAMRIAGPVFFSQTGFIVTLAGVFWGWLLFGETHSAYVWAAIAAIFTGLALVTRAGRK